jgi:proline iminopeptidase
MKSDGIEVQGSVRRASKTHSATRGWTPFCRRVLLLMMALMLVSSAPAAPPVSEGMVATPDGDLYYERLGEGPAIVMVAGGPGASHTSLRPDFDRLATGHTLVYFDNIGRGRSSELPAGRHHSPPRDAEDIERLRQALGFERITVIGHSYGGYVALAYAGRYPQRLDHLVISSGGHGAQSWQRNIDSYNAFVENQYPEVWSKLLALRAKGVKTCAKEYQDLNGEAAGDTYWYDLANAGKRKPFSTDERDRFRSDVYCDMIGDDPEVKVGGAMASFDARPALAAVHAPTWISAGRYDRVSLPKVALEIRDAFAPGVARETVFEKSGHRPWVEEPDAFFAELDKFLAAPPAKP